MNAVARTAWLGCLLAFASAARGELLEYVLGDSVAQTTPGGGTAHLSDLDGGTDFAITRNGITATFVASGGSLDAGLVGLGVSQGEEQDEPRLSDGETITVRFDMDVVVGYVQVHPASENTCALFAYRSSNADGEQLDCELSSSGYHLGLDPPRVIRAGIDYVVISKPGLPASRAKMGSDDFAIVALFVERSLGGDPNLGEANLAASAGSLADVRLNEMVDVHFLVSNLGPDDATDVRAIIEISEHVGFVAHPPLGTRIENDRLDPSTIYWVIDSMPARGNTLLMDLTVQPLPGSGDAVTITIDVAGDQLDLRPNDNAATVGIEVTRAGSGEVGAPQTGIALFICQLVTCGESCDDTMAAVLIGLVPLRSVHRRRPSR